jgi:hypothetical protein
VQLGDRTLAPDQWATWPAERNGNPMTSPGNRPASASGIGGLLPRTRAGPDTRSPPGHRRGCGRLDAAIGAAQEALPTMDRLEKLREAPPWRVGHRLLRQGVQEAVESRCPAPMAAKVWRQPDQSRKRE